MAKTKEVFERQEKKFLLDHEQYTVFKQVLPKYMQLDQYGLHTISSVYYDTQDFQIIRHALEKPIFREKLRLRSYGTPKAEDKVFLELKKKFSGVTYKRRITLPLWEADAYLKYGIPPRKNNQIFAEIDWFKQKQPLEAKILLSYDRLAFFGRQDPELRLTIDEHIRWRDYNLDLGKGDYGSFLLYPTQRLLEIKTWQAIPCWLSSLLSELAIYPTSFSKYGKVYENHLQEREGLRHVG